MAFFPAVRIEGQWATQDVLAPVRAFLEGVPVPSCGVALGVVTLGKLLGGMGLSAVENACLAVAVALMTLLTLRIALCPRGFVRELDSAVTMSVFANYFMTFVQLSTYMLPVSCALAVTMWLFGVGGHVFLAIAYALRRASDPRLGDVHTTWFVCFGGYVVGSVTAPSFGVEAAGLALFWVGFALCLAAAPLVALRYAKVPVPAAARPTFCIFSAPTSLLLAGYLACTATPDVPFVVALTALDQLLYLMVLTRLPSIVRAGFYPSFAAMTFPLASTANTLGQVSVALSAQGVATGPMAAIALVEAGVACVVVAFVAGCYAVLLSRRAIGVLGCVLQQGSRAQS